MAMLKDLCDTCPEDNDTPLIKPTKEKSPPRTAADILREARARATRPSERVNWRTILSDTVTAVPLDELDEDF